MPGARHAIGILQSEVDRVLALLGCPSIRNITPDYLWHPGLQCVPPEFSVP